MKKIVAIVAFLSINVSLCFAQAGLSEIRFGFQMSPSFGWMSTNVNSINPNGTSLGLKLGMIGEYFFQENAAFTSGLGFHFNAGGTLFHEIGGTYWTKSDLGNVPDPLPDGVSLDYSIQYVEIPIGIKMRTKEFGYLRYYIQPAFTIGFNTQARGSIKGPGVGEDAEKLDVRKEVNALNLAWGIGGGVEYSISESTSLIGGLGLQVGFTDATDDNGTVADPSGSTDEDSKGTVNSLTIMIGIMF